MPDARDDYDQLVHDYIAAREHYDRARQRYNRANDEYNAARTEYESARNEYHAVAGYDNSARVVYDHLERAYEQHVAARDNDDRPGYHLVNGGINHDGTVHDRPV